MTNKNNLRKFLTTASALAMITTGAYEANAAAAHDVNGPAATSATATNAADAWKLNNAAAVLTVDDARTLAVAVNHGINPGVGPSIIISNAAVTLNTVTNNDTGNTAAASANLKIGVDTTLTLSGAGQGGGLFTSNLAANTAAAYNKLGNVDFNGTTSTVNITGNNGVFAGNFDNVVGGGVATLTLSGTNNLFKGGFGATNALNVVNVGDDTNFGDGVGANVAFKAGAINVGNGKTLTVQGNGVNFVTVTGNIAANAGQAAVLVSKGTNAGVANLFQGNIAGVDTFTVTTDATVGGVAGATDHTVANTTVANNMKLTIDSNNVGSDVGWTGNIKGAADTQGMFATSGAKAVVIKGDVGAGGNRLASATINADTTFQPSNADNGVVAFSGGVTLNNNTLTFDATNHALTVTINGGNGDIAAGFNGQGVVKLIGAAGKGVTVNSRIANGGFANSLVVRSDNATTHQLNKALNFDAGVSTNNALDLSAAAGITKFGALVTINNGSVLTGTGAVTFSNGVTANAGNITTGTGAVTVNGAALTMNGTNLGVDNVARIGAGGLDVGGQGINFAGASGGVMHLQSHQIKGSGADFIKNADIIGGGTILVSGADATITNSNIGVLTNKRVGATNVEGVRSDSSPDPSTVIQVATDHALTVVAGDAGVLTNDIYAAIKNTNAAQNIGAVVFKGSNAGAILNMHNNIGEANKTLKAVTIGGTAQMTLNLSANNGIYTATAAQNTGGVITLGDVAGDLLGLSDESVVQGWLTPGDIGANIGGGLSVNTTNSYITLNVDTSVNALAGIAFNKAAASDADMNGVIIPGRLKANFTQGAEIKGGDLTFGAAVTDTLTGVAIDMKGIADNNTKLTFTKATVGHVAGAGAGAGAIGFTNTDAKATPKQTATLSLGTAAQYGNQTNPLGLIHAGGALTELNIAGNTTGVYVSNVTGAPVVNFTAVAGAVYGINLDGEQVKYFNIQESTTLNSFLNNATVVRASIGSADKPLANLASTVAGKTLTINDGVDLYVTNLGAATTTLAGVATTKGVAATYTFGGINTVDTTGGSFGTAALPVEEIKVNNNAIANCNVTLQGGDIYVGAAGISFAHRDDTATILSNVHGAIRGTKAFGIATFGKDSASDLTVDGNGANGIALANAKINGKLTLVSGAYDVGTTTFLGDGTLTLTKTATVTGLGTVVATTAGQGTININQNYTTNNSIGTSAAAIKELSIGEKATLTVADNHNVYANITGAGSTVSFASANNNTSTVLNIGAKDANVGTVTHTANGAVVAGDVFADTFTVTNGGTFSATNFTTKNGLTLTNGTAILADKGTLAGGAKGAGAFETAGNATVSGLANTGGLNLKGAVGSVVTLADTSVASTVTHTGGEFALTGNTTVTGAYNVPGGATGAVLNLAGNSFTSSAAGTIDSPVTIKIKRDAGNTAPILINPGMTLQNGGAITIVVDNTTILSGDVVVNGASAGVTVGNLTGGSNKLVTVQNGLFVTTTVSTDGNIITFTPGATAQTVLGTGTNVVADSNASEFGKAMATALNTNAAAGDMPKLLAQLSSMTNAEKAEAAQDMSNKAVDTQTSTAAIPQALGAVNSAVQGATGAAATARVEVASADAGVAAGSDVERFGVWTQVMGGVGTQKQRKSLSGFSSNMMGGLIGADTMLNDNATFGILVSNVNNNIKFKDADSGNKAKANSWVFGGYGSYDIGATDFFVQGNVTVAQTSVKSNSKVLVGGTQNGAAKVYQTAKGKYDILGFGAEVVGGYKFKFENSFVAPTVGLRYNYAGDTSYTQTGLSAGNQTIKTKATSVVSALAGLRVGTSIDMDGMMIRPEVHGNLSYAFNSPASKTSYTFNGLNSNVNYTGPKPSKFGANFGTSVMAEADGFEYGVGYDAMINDKYLGHQGSVKVKVKF